MNKELFTTLKELKNINPNPDYSKKSRFLILSKERPVCPIINYNSIRFINPAKFSLILGFFIILIISGGFYYINKSNKNELIVKASELNSSIQIKLNEIKYFLESDNQHLSNEKNTTIQSILKKTADELKEARDLSQKNEDLKKSLEKIKAAQKSLLEIAEILK